MKTAKQEMKDKSRPYQVYTTYLALPIVFIAIMIMSFFGYNNSSTGILILIFTIVAHVGAKKLTLAGKRKYVAPILMYVANVISLVLFPVLFSDLSSGGNGDSYFSLIGLIVVPIEIIAGVFFFIGAHDLKKAYPAMKQDSKDARETYLAVKRATKMKQR